MSAVSNLETGCTGLQVRENLGSQESGTRQGSSRERSHLRLMLRWERNRLHQESCRFLEEERQKESQRMTTDTRRRAKDSCTCTHQHQETRRRRLVSPQCSTVSWRVTCHSWDSPLCQRTFQWLQKKRKPNINFIALTLYRRTKRQCTKQISLSTYVQPRWSQACSWESPSRICTSQHPTANQSSRYRPGRAGPAWCSLTPPSWGHIHRVPTPPSTHPP